MTFEKNDTADSPLVSVIIPAYNRAEFTVQCVESVLNQTYTNIEVIVVDDGSTDDTSKKLDPYKNRITYIHKENGGACSARNVGLQTAHGEYIALIDCDDLYLPDKIELSVRYLQRYPQYGMVHTNLYYVDENKRILKQGGWGKNRFKGWIKEKLIVVNLISNTTVLIHRDCFEKVGLFNEDLFPPADWDMWLRICEHYPVGYIEKPLAMYRVTSNWNVRFFERVGEEEKFVLDHFFDRNPDVSKRIKNKAYSRLHFTMAKYYVIEDNDEKTKEHLLLSMALNPLNIKVNIMFLYTILARNALKKLVAKTMFVEH